jgi:type VI secretion system protein ImpA
MNRVPVPLRAVLPPTVPARTAIDWLHPIDPHAPCGPSLEYDHDYAVLRSRMVPRTEAQYGSFVGMPEAPPWSEIDRDCQRLLLRTKDINLLVWWCRARTRLGQAAGLAQVLALLHDLLQAWPEAIHPQRIIDGEPEPAVRANALAGLADLEGLLADVGEIVVASNTALRLTVRDVERAFAMPRPPDAASPESVTRQLAALHIESRGQPQAPVTLLARAAERVHAIDAWGRVNLGDDAPSLRALSRVLDLFRDPAGGAAAAPSSCASADARAVSVATPATLAIEPGRTRSRDDVLASIRRSREWFEHHEPSSPVAVLLKQAERMVGKRFSQVADSIPLDLLQRWETTPDIGEIRP